VSTLSTVTAGIRGSSLCAAGIATNDWTLE